MSGVTDTPSQEVQFLLEGVCKVVVEFLVSKSNSSSVRILRATPELVSLSVLVHGTFAAHFEFAPANSHDIPHANLRIEKSSRFAGAHIRFSSASQTGSYFMRLSPEFLSKLWDIVKMHSLAPLGVLSNLTGSELRTCVEAELTPPARARIPMVRIATPVSGVRLAR